MQKKIVILSNNDLSSNIIFEKVISSFSDNIKGVYFDGKIVKGCNNRVSGAFSLLKKMDLIYWVYLAYTGLMFGFSAWFNKNNIKRICADKDVSTEVIQDFSSASFISMIKDISPDLILVRCSQILSSELIDLVNGEVYCVHSSILPSYKGIAAEFHCLRNGEKYIGTSIFKVVEKLDAGTVVSSNRLESDRDESVFRNMVRNNVMARNLLFDFVATGKLNSTFNLEAHSYYSWPTKKQRIMLKHRGIKIIKLSEIVELMKFAFFGKRIWH